MNPKTNEDQFRNFMLNAGLGTSVVAALDEHPFDKNLQHCGRKSVHWLWNFHEKRVAAKTE